MIQFVKLHLLEYFILSSTHVKTSACHKLSIAENGIRIWVLRIESFVAVIKKMLRNQNNYADEENSTAEKC